MKIFAGSSNQEIAKQIAKKLDLKLGTVEISKFANGEKRIWVTESVKGENIVIVQSFSQPVDEYIL